MAEATDAKVVTETKEATFDKEDIINAASQFDTTIEIMAGALYDVTGPITKADAKKRLDDFLSRPIKNIDK